MYDNKELFGEYITQVCVALSHLDGQIWMPEQNCSSSIWMVSQDGHNIACYNAKGKVEYAGNSVVLVGDKRVSVNIAPRIGISSKKDASRVARELNSRLLVPYKLAVKEAIVKAGEQWEKEAIQAEFAVKVCEVMMGTPDKFGCSDTILPYRDGVRSITIHNESIYQLGLQNAYLTKFEKILEIMRAE